MKNIVSLVVFITTLILFTGCASHSDFPVVKKIENSSVVEISVNENDSFEAVKDWSELALYDAIKKASEYSLSQGYTHFAILNGGINNLQGFPVTNYKDLRDYCLIYKFNQSFYGSTSYAKCENISYKNSPGVILKIIPVNESSEIFSWNAKEVLAELK